MRHLDDFKIHNGHSEGCQSWMNELIWREFYVMILDQFPHVEKKAFKPQYEHIKWVNNKNSLRNGAKEKTGFPLIDAL